MSSAPRTGNTPRRCEGQIKATVSELVDTVNGFDGLLQTLFSGIHAASEAGRHVESDEDRAADIQAALNQAEREIEGNDYDPEAVVELIEGARSAASRFHRGLDADLAGFELPEHIDRGVYETLGSYAEYVEEFLTFVVGRVDELLTAAAE